jgi:hypothetical protein
MGFTVIPDDRAQPVLALLDDTAAAGPVAPLQINPIKTSRSAAPTLQSLTDPAAVVAAIAEFDRLGGPQFRAKYDYGDNTTFKLVHNGREYDSKAIAGVALAYQPGVNQALDTQLRGGQRGAAARLRALGFTVTSTPDATPAKLVDPATIRQAMQEWDRIGSPAFLQKYGAHPSTKYFVVEGGRTYDAKALVQAAYRIENPRRPPLAANDFRGDRRSIAEPLRNHGFWVEEPSAAEGTAEPPLGPDSSRYIDAAARILGDLDRPVAGTARREQDLLRGALGLFRDHDMACALCRQVLPASLLVAAHIKPRSQCTPTERLDVQHIGMAACLLGCDALFERGLVAVSEHGSLLTSPFVGSNKAVSAYVSRLPATIDPRVVWRASRLLQLAPRAPFQVVVGGKRTAPHAANERPKILPTPPRTHSEYPAKQEDQLGPHSAGSATAQPGRGPSERSVGSPKVDRSPSELPPGSPPPWLHIGRCQSHQRCRYRDHETRRQV